MKIFALNLAVLLLATLSENHAIATVGLAEWEIKTPGGHLISHIDPIKERYSTCLRKPDKTPGLINQPEVYVSHLKWWQYYNGYVIGKGNKGYFIFNERSKKTEFFGTRTLLEQTIETRRLGSSRSKKMTPGDGWEMAWGGEFAKRDPSYKRKWDEGLKKTCELMRERVRLQPDKFSLDDREQFEIMCNQ